MSASIARHFSDNFVDARGVISDSATFARFGATVYRSKATQRRYEDLGTAVTDALTGDTDMWILGFVRRQCSGARPKAGGGVLSSTGDRLPGAQIIWTTAANRIVCATLEHGSDAIDANGTGISPAALHWTRSLMSQGPSSPIRSATNELRHRKVMFRPTDSTTCSSRKVQIRIAVNGRRSDLRRQHRTA